MLVSQPFQSIASQLAQPALHAPSPHPLAHRPLPEESPDGLPEAFDCRELLAALAEAQREWSASDAHARLQPARALLERVAHDAFREHDARAALARDLHHLLQQAEALVRPHDLHGPTGESNTLLCEARGLLACVCRAGAVESDVLLPALAALLTGNAVLMLYDAATRGLVHEVRNLLSEAGFPDELTTHHALPGVAAMQSVLANCAIDGVLCHGDPALAQALSRTLAARSGALLPLIDEAFGPLYAERLVLEKTVSVTTTAAGGNMALRSQAESD